jgi:hypothetical protein
MAAALSQKRAGKGVSWSEDEVMALCHAAHIVGSDPVRGANMKKEDYANAIKAEFLRDSLRPSAGGTSGKIDERRWEGRSASSLLSQWKKLRSDCTRFHAVCKRVDRLELTGGPSEEDIFRIATAVYNDGAEALAHAYDIVRNKEYRTGKPFLFLSAYKWLVVHTQHLMAGESDNNIGVDADGEKYDSEIQADMDDPLDHSRPRPSRESTAIDRPEGSKTAKKRRRIAGTEKYNKSSDELNRSTAENVSSIVQMIGSNEASDAKVITQSMDLEKERVHLERERMNFDKNSLRLQVAKEILSSRLSSENDKQKAQAILMDMMFSTQENLADSTAEAGQNDGAEIS